MSISQIPLIVYAFDRPAYLRTFCTSLKRQFGIASSIVRPFLFQDGAVSDLTGVRYANDDDILECKRVFLQEFPEGVIKASESNLGIAKNILRGEKFVFDVLHSEFGLFFEDDLELGPYYLNAMDALLDIARSDERIGYFAAYGNHYAPGDPNQTKIVEMDHNWGFVLRRKSWEQMMIWMEDYFEILSQSDYKYRNDWEVYNLFTKLGVASSHTSQDIVRTLACAELGICRIMTDACFARYIGAAGESFNLAKYKSMGYDRMQAAQKSDFSIERPDELRISTLMEDAWKKHSSYRNSEFPSFWQNFRDKNPQPLRLITAEEIRDLYRLILDRDVEDDPINEHAGKTCIRVFRAALMASKEARAKNARVSDRS